MEITLHDKFAKFFFWLKLCKNDLIYAASHSAIVQVLGLNPLI